MQLKNDLLLRAARGEKTERTPVWIMRQAGRTLTEYKQVREKAGSFINLVTNPEYAAEVTIQPVDIHEVDAAILFSDILVVPEAMGLPYTMVEKKGPQFPETIQSKEDINRLKPYEEGSLDYVMQAIKLTKKELNNRAPLIGFSGAPWTLFCYMVEGSGSKTFSKSRAMLYREPEMAHLLLSKITDAVIAYLKDQVAAGVDIIQVFDSWAGILGPDQYHEFAVPYINRIGEAISGVPKIIFAKGAFFARKTFNSSPYDVVGLDWNMGIGSSRRLVPDKVLQGNLDPCALFGTFDEIRKSTRDMVEAFGQHHIANLGHGVYPEIERDHIRCFVDAVKEYSLR